MKKFIKKIKSNKFLYILSVLIVGVFFILIARVTYAFLAPIINNAQTNIVIKGDIVDEFKLKVGNTLKLDATPTTLKENGTNYTTSTTATASLKANSTKNTATYNYYLYFQIENNTFTYTSGTTPEIILTITNPNGEEVTSIEGLTYGTFNGVSGFDVTTQSGLFNIANNYIITSNSSTTATIHEWTVTLTYLNQAYDQSGNFGKSMEVGVLLQKEEIIQTAINKVCKKNQKLTECIIATNSIDETLYHHDGSLENGINDNSYRFAGASSTVNNYVCFGSTTTPCPADNLYRIIGVFDNQVGENQTEQRVKLIKSTSVGDKQWNSTDDNTWSTSSLNAYLNNEFINAFDETTKGKIADTTWKVGGNTSANIKNQPAKTAYQNEVVNPVPGSTSSNGETEHPAKIGLMYASDYGFAAAQSAWTTQLSSYNGEVIKNVNWMYLGADEWTISRYADYSGSAFFVRGSGFVAGSRSNRVTYVSGVRPVFSLSSSTSYVSGSGTTADPITIN